MIDALCACWLVVTAASQHAQPEGMNQYNPGIGLEYKAWAAGEYRNSLDRTTFYIVRDVWSIGDAYKAKLVAGAASGYKPVAGMHVLPVVLPELSVEGRHVGINLALIPNPVQWNKSAVALQLKWRF